MRTRAPSVHVELSENWFRKPETLKGSNIIVDGSCVQSDENSR